MSLSGTLEGREIITLPKPGNDLTFTKITSDETLIHYEQTLWEADFKKHANTHRGKKLAICKSVWDSSNHSTVLQRMRLVDHVTLNFNNNMPMAAVFLDMEKAFHTWWHPGLPYKLSELEFSTILHKLIASFLPNRKFKVLVEGELSASKETVEAVPQGSALAPVLYSPYTNDAPAAAGTHLALFADDTCIYTTEKHERRVLCKLQRGLTAVKSWCER
jgi:hypothetical protein